MSHKHNTTSEVDVDDDDEDLKMRSWMIATGNELKNIEWHSEVYICVGSHNMDSPIWPQSVYKLDTHVTSVKIASSLLE